MHIVLRHMLDYEDRASDPEESASVENGQDSDSSSSDEELDERATGPSPQPAVLTEVEADPDPIAMDSMDNAIGNLFKGSAKQHWQYEVLPLMRKPYGLSGFLSGSLYVCAFFHLAQAHRQPLDCHWINNNPTAKNGWVSTW